MPKISTNNVRVQDANLFRAFDVAINYDTKTYQFFAKIPTEFLELESILGQEKKDEFAIHLRKEEPIIIAESEQLCLSRMTKCIQYFVQCSIKRRNVIIVYYNTEIDATWHSFRFDRNFQKIGLNYGLTFAEEVSSGDERSYAIFVPYENNGTKINRVNINWHRHNNITVIDDTPENRIKLEQLYAAITTLKTKLQSVLGSSENLLNFINSDIKLLN